MPLSAAERLAYDERGFVVRRNLFSIDLVDLLGEQIDGLHERMARDPAPDVHVSWEDNLASDRPPRIRQLMHSERVSSVLDAMSRDAELLSILAQLIGPDVILFHSKLMMKAARDGSFTPWHQDWGYWQHESKQPTHVNCMVAIDPMLEENGTIRFVAGSHRRGAKDHQDFASSSFRLGLEGDLDAYASELVELHPGDAVIFGPLVIHASAPNTSGRNRRANTFAFDRVGNALRGVDSPERLRLGSLSPAVSAASAAAG